MGTDNSISNLNLGLLISAESGLPSFLVKLAVKRFLTQFEFTETNFGEFTLYKRPWYTYDGEAIPLLVWVKGKYIFAAISGQESYAYALVSSTIAINR